MQIESSYLEEKDNKPDFDRELERIESEMEHYLYIASCYSCKQEISVEDLEETNYQIADYDFCYISNQYEPIFKHLKCKEIL